MEPAVLVSVIIPALNEAAAIARAVESATVDGVEVIVADGGSTDGTVERAAASGAVVLAAPACRARQMNAGAALARGDYLLFLHADTTLPSGFAQHVHETLARPGVLVGAFGLDIDGRGAIFRFFEWLVRWRCRLLRLPYGDQTLFFRAQTFRRLGGFPDIPAMEDFALVCRLRRLGGIGLAPARVTTSARRWLDHGLLRTTMVNRVSILAYQLGITPERIATWRRRWFGGRPVADPSKTRGSSSPVSAALRFDERTGV